MRDPAARAVTAVLLAALFCAPLSSASGTDWVLLHLEAGSLEDLREQAAVLERAGASVRNFFPPDTAIARVPADLDLSSISGLSPRLRVYRPSEDAGAAAGSPSLESWRGVLKWLNESEGQWIEHGDHTMGSDAVEVPPELRFEWEGMAARAPASCAQSNGSSLYLVGDVSIGIVMPESSDLSPNSETWDTVRQDRVVAEIVQAGSILSEQVLPWAGLDFFYDVRRSVPVDVEPIELPWGEASRWARDAVIAMGHRSAWEYVNHIRDAHGTDWGVAAFVADDLNDGDNRFADGTRFAFAYLGGPSLWMTYDNNGWGIDKMDTVFAHELGHSFDALDEYASSQPRCDRKSGVLRVENQNAAAVGGCLLAEGCIMKANSMTSGSDGSDPSAPLQTGYCIWSLGQLGSRDLDGDNLADIRNVPPQSFLDEVLPHPVNTSDLVVSGSATALPSDLEIGEESWASHTLNEIARVDYRLDGGPWTAADGGWGERCAEFEVSLTDLAEGWHTLETRAASLVCESDDIEICDPPRERLEESYAVQDFYVDTDCPDDAHEQNDRFSDSPSIPSGLQQGLRVCAFDRDYYSVYLREGAALGVEVRYDDPATPLELSILSPGGQELAHGVGAAGSAVAGLAEAEAEGNYRILVDGGGEYETAYSLTVVAECIDDRLEPNGGQGLAKEIRPGIESDLQICDGDEDWYLVPVGSGAEISATIRFDHALGDLELALLREDGSLVDESATGGDEETVGAAALAGGLYYLRVRGSVPDADNRYELELALNGCLDDRMENNDWDVEASAISVGRSGDLRLCAWDEDWYRFELQDPSFLRVEAIFQNEDGNLDLEVLDAAQNRIGGSWSSENVERVDVQHLVPGTYFLKVQGRNGAANPRYDIDLTVANPVRLFATKRDQQDVLLNWTEVGMDCYDLHKSDRAPLVDATFYRSTGIPEDGQEESSESATEYEDIGAVDGTKLWFYRVFPGFCAGGELLVTKTFEPYPAFSRNGTGTETYFTIKLRNAGRSTISDITVRDDLTILVGGFSVFDLPPGATDRSEPTGGQFGRGFVEVDLPPLGPGEESSFRVFVQPDFLGSPNQKSSILRNHATVTALDGGSGEPLRVLSDDPATLAYPDSTDIALPVFGSTGDIPLLVRAFWNQDVDIALRVEDPCGNLIGSEDAANADCSGSSGWVAEQGGCGDPWPWGWAEAIEWRTPAPAPTPGEYRVWVRLAEDRDSGGSCLHAGPEDVVVLVDTITSGTQWEWLILDPSDRDWQEAIVFTIP